MDYKIVINSCEHFEVCLTECLNSLLKTGFDQYKNIIVVIGNSETPHHPKLIPISEITNLKNHNKVIVARIEQNNFEFNSIIALYKYRNNNLFKSKYFFYTNDTTQFLVDFTQKIDLIPRDYDIVTGKNPFANIMFISKKYINLVKNIFDGKISKQEAIGIEFGSERKFPKLKSFGKFLEYGSRFQEGKKNSHKIYGSLRTKYVYSEYGIVKYCKMFSIKTKDEFLKP